MARPGQCRTTGSSRSRDRVATPSRRGRVPADSKLAIEMRNTWTMVDDGARQRMYNAVEALEGAGPIKDRLETAGLTLLPLMARDFPSGQQQDLFEQVLASLTKVSGTPDEGHLRRTILGMNEDTAVSVAKDIARLFYLVASDYEE
jgi:hypothetical protein